MPALLRKSGVAHASTLVWLGVVFAFGCALLKSGDRKDVSTNSAALANPLVQQAAGTSQARFQQNAVVDHSH
eukprot:3413432-Amphidinium_carterae.5